MMATIVLNCIVKNELARIERMLRSVAPHIAGAMICDTGSTDGTQAKAMAFLAQAAVMAQLAEFGFEDFSSARNRALSEARAFVGAMEIEWSREFSNADGSALEQPVYFLLADADMELVVEDPEWAANLTAPAYTLVQRHGGLEYGNVRLLRADVPAVYSGRTHEVLHVEGVERLTGAHFIDHADGANRADKFNRDISLLEKDLADRPHDPRALFYLGQSHKDLGMHGLAAAYYDARAAVGGWDEEVYCALLYAGRCYLAIGDEAKGVDRLMAAYSRRPSRAEAPAALARHYRLKPDRQAVAVAFAQAAMETAPSQDVLFVEPAAQDEAHLDFAICAWYSPDPAVKAHGRYICDSLATDRSVPDHIRQTARMNLMWYAQSLEEMFPGARRQRVDFPVEDGWWPMNASILKQGDTIWFLQRVVNFVVDKVTGAYSMPEGITRTRNFLCTLDPATYAVTSRVELRIDPEPEVLFPWVQGFEDMRLFFGDAGHLWVSATTRQLTPNGLCEIVEGRISGDSVVDWRVVSTRSENRNEKNWAPITDRPHEWLYAHDPAIVQDGTVRCFAHNPSHAIDHFRGSSQLIRHTIRMIGGTRAVYGYIAIEHEVVEAFGPRKYLHRFVRYDENCVPLRFTLPFHFAPLAHNGNQFVAGIMDGGDCYVVPYSLNDEESHLAFIPKSEIGL